MRVTLEKRAFPSVRQVSKVVSLDAANSLADEDLVNDDRLDEEGIDGSLSLQPGPSNCCSTALHLHHTKHSILCSVFLQPMLNLCLAYKDVIVNVNIRLTYHNIMKHLCRTEYASILLKIVSKLHLSYCCKMLRPWAFIDNIIRIMRDIIYLMMQGENSSDCILNTY